MYSEKRLGQWTVLVDEEQITISQNKATLLEKFLNGQWLPLVRKQYAGYPKNYAMRAYNVPSVLIRLDMAPMFHYGAELGIYEVEANTAGYGVAHLTGSPLTSLISDALLRLGITEIGCGFAPSRTAQKEDLNILTHAMQSRGIRISYLQNLEYEEPSPFHTGVPHVPLWLRAGEEDMSSISYLLPQCLLLHNDGGGHKDYLRQLTGARLLSECYEGFIDPFKEFPQGFAYKPVRGWGTHGIYIWCPQKPWSRFGMALAKMKNILRETEKPDQILIQPFFPPESCDDGYFRIWRVYAIWTPSGYKVIGGVWSSRKSLLNHGAGDTITGQIGVVLM